MKRIISVLLVGIAIFTLTFTNSALAADAGAGLSVFEANCNACHIGGKNLVNAAKTLKKEALEKYNMYSQEAIVRQVTKGKGAMPAFGQRLKKDQIENVAAYVLEQAGKGWKN
jgi:cytochrome c6